MGNTIRNVHHTFGNSSIAGTIGGIILCNERVVHHDRDRCRSASRTQDVHGELGIEGANMTDRCVDDLEATGVVATKVEIDQIVGVARHIEVLVATTSPESQCNGGCQAIS